MEFSDAVKARRSIREYEPHKILADEQVKELFELVRLSPSSYNLQPWEFIVVREPGNKKRLRACAQNQRHVEEASATVIILGTTDPRQHAEEIAADRVRKGTMDAAKKTSFEAAVQRLAQDKIRSRLWATRSTSLAAMTLMLAAQDMGLASCPLEGFDADCIRKEFGIPESYEVVLLVTLGYPSREPPERPMRYPPSRTVHLEGFGNRLPSSEKYK